MMTQTHHSSAQSFTPPSTRFGLGFIAIALLIHGLLMAALTWGIRWKSDPQSMAAAAELWAEIPVQAAPALSAPPPAPEPALEKTAPPKPPALPEAAIVTQKIKSKEKVESPKKEAPKKAPPKKEQKVEPTKKKEAETAQQLEKIRQDQIKRMAGLAGATGTASSAGQALQSAAPSANYAGKVEAKIRPNITFSEMDSVQGNPATEVDIRIAMDGTIVGTPKIVHASGNKAWDAAVLRAIEKTETLPRDTDGRIPSRMILILRPKR